MNYKQVLEYLGFQEEVDFILTQSSFQMTPKFEEVITQRATYDMNGNELVPEIKEQVDVTPLAPSQEVLEDAALQIQLDGKDLGALVNAYLADKLELRDPENDELNISNFKIARWNFSNIPCPTKQQLIDLIETAQSTMEQAATNEEALKYLASTDWLIVRESETGVSCPIEVKVARAQARARIIR